MPTKIEWCDDKQLVDSRGYILIRCPNHPRAKANGYVYKHHLIAEQKLGRPLKRTEIVHHINGNTMNNDICNLAIITRSEHKLCHYSLQHCIAELFARGEVKFKDGVYYVE